MCLYPKLIRNPKYLPNKKNGGVAPICTDKRLLYVPVGCGECIECRRQKANAWRVRVAEELRRRKQAKFVTLTFSEEKLNEMKEWTQCEDENKIATAAMRLFLERWRKKFKHSLRHWCVTEKGQEGTERIHLHGIFFRNENTTEEEWEYISDNEKLQSIWQYGITDVGYMCNQQTVNYLVKYILKPDPKHEDFKTKILASAGIGQGWTERIDTMACIYKPNGQTKQLYTLPNGHRIRLPMYYRNKIYTDDEREKLWLEAIESGDRYTNGIKVHIYNDRDYWTFIKILKDQQEKSERLGYKRPKWEENYTFNLHN